MVEVLGLGELLWDCFPEERRPGGAPANFAFQAQQFGLSAGVVTRVGHDALGRELCQYLQRHGLSTELVQHDSEHPTGTVAIDLADPRAARYDFPQHTAYDYLEPLPTLLAACGKARALCFGTLAQRHDVSRATIAACVAAVPDDCFVVYDVNLRPPWWQPEWVDGSLRHCHAAKLNDEECRLLGPALFGSELSEWALAGKLLDRYDTMQLVIITRGGNGCLLVGRDGSSEQPGIEVDVVDTVGSGDAFTAAVVWGRLHHWPLDLTAQLANRTGALGAARAGAMPRIHDEVHELKRSLSAHLSR